MLDISLMDSTCALREHSYQLSYKVGYSIGALQAFPWMNEHTHIIKTYFIDKRCAKSYIMVYGK